MQLDFNSLIRRKTLPLEVRCFVSSSQNTKRPTSSSPKTATVRHLRPVSRPAKLCFGTRRRDAGEGPIFVDNPQPRCGGPWARRENRAVWQHQPEPVSALFLRRKGVMRPTVTATLSPGVPGRTFLCELTVLFDPALRLLVCVAPEPGPTSASWPPWVTLEGRLQQGPRTVSRFANYTRTIL